MSTFVVDASFGHAQITPANMRKIGASGAILYAGCNDTTKNCTRSEVQALLEAGVHVGLVIENTATGMLGGRSEGVAFGKAVLAGAKSVGYDAERCVLYTAADWNVSSSQEPTVDAFMAGFGSVVPVPGLYSNSHALDYAAAHGHARFFWQSDSTSFSAGPSRHAHLLQRYNDQRAHGLPVDVNDIQHTPLGLMGEDMPLDPKDPVIAALTAQIADVHNDVWLEVPGKASAQPWTLLTQALAAIEKSQATQAAATATLQAAVHELAAAVDAIQAGGGQVDPVAVAKAIAEHVGLTAK